MLTGERIQKTYGVVMGCDPVPEIFRIEAPGKSREENAADLGNMSGISRYLNLLYLRYCLLVSISFFSMRYKDRRYLKD